MTHELKCLPVFFEAISSGIKTFEIRNDDRGFHYGDTLILNEWHEDTGYTGKKLSRRVGYLTDYEQRSGYIVMSIFPV